MKDITIGGHARCNEGVGRVLAQSESLDQETNLYLIDLNGVRKWLPRSALQAVRIRKAVGRRRETTKVEERLILDLRFKEHMPIRAIAKSLGLSVGKVTRQLYRARPVKDTARSVVHHQLVLGVGGSTTCYYQPVSLPRIPAIDGPYREGRRHE